MLSLIPLLILFNDIIHRFIDIRIDTVTDIIFGIIDLCSDIIFDLIPHVIIDTVTDIIQ